MFEDLPHIAPYEVIDSIDELLRNPVKIEGFAPLTRAEANTRTPGVVFDPGESSETDYTQENDTA
jgi:hypothetical protein